MAEDGTVITVITLFTVSRRSGGGNSEYRLRGEQLARSETVTIVVNYRLSILGLFALNELKAEDPNTPTTGHLFILPLVIYLFYHWSLFFFFIHSSTIYLYSL
jgi:hypothetical protein